MRNARRFLPAIALVMALALLAVAGPSQALDRVDREGDVVIGAGEHFVLLDFETVDLKGTWDLGKASTVNYAVSLSDSSVQQEFDVLLMTYGDYLNYSQGLSFDFIAAASTLGAGELPATSSYIFLIGDRYVLLIDNSMLGEAPTASGSLGVQYQCAGTNMELMDGSNWDGFIVLMVLVIVMGAAFLIVLNMALRRKAQQRSKPKVKDCASCGKTIPFESEYCQHCGAKNER